MKDKSNQTKSGFTLIELLTTMTIIAVLAGLALVSLQGARKSARDGKRKADLEQIRSALEMCRSDTGSYPAGPLYSGQNISCGVPAQTYLQIPADPLPDRRYYYNRLSPTSYELCAALEVGGSTVCPANSCTVNCNFRLTNP
ncbi:MAG: type II secretion system protein [Anaerolineales bacterium]